MPSTEAIAADFNETGGFAAVDAFFRTDDSKQNKHGSDKNLSNFTSSSIHSNKRLGVGATKDIGKHIGDDDKPELDGKRILRVGKKRKNLPQDDDDIDDNDENDAHHDEEDDDDIGRTAIEDKQEGNSQNIRNDVKAIEKKKKKKRGKKERMLLLGSDPTEGEGKTTEANEHYSEEVDNGVKVSNQDGMIVDSSRTNSSNHDEKVMKERNGLKAADDTSSNQNNDNNQKKRYRKKVRSRQKNIRKDKRSVKPEHLQIGSTNYQGRPITPETRSKLNLPPSNTMIRSFIDPMTGNWKSQKNATTYAPSTSVTTTSQPRETVTASTTSQLQDGGGD